jgi:SHAQKYF class myb-like DNA-binding protein
MELVPALETLISVYGHLGGNDNNNNNKNGNTQAQASQPQSDSTNGVAVAPQPAVGKVTGKRSSSRTTNNSSVISSEGESDDNPPQNKKARKSPTENSAKKPRIKKPTAKNAPSKSNSEASDDDADDVAAEEKARFRWTDELHQYFLACVFELGLEAASPKKVFNKMMADSNFAKTVLDEELWKHLLSPDGPRMFGAHHVKSHLQRFRTNIENPRAMFVKQVSELMQEAKKKKKLDKTNKVLNPEYHAYPFTVDRQFPGSELVINQQRQTGVNNSNHAEAPLPLQYNPANTLGNNQGKFASMPIAQQMYQPQLHYNPLATSSSAGASAFSTDKITSLSLLARPRAFSSLEANEQMRAQVEMRERIESQGQRQVVGSLGNEDDFDALPVTENDDNLFDWLVGPEFFPRHDEAASGAGAAAGSSSEEEGRNK